MLKAVCKGASKEAKLFTLRNVMQSSIISCDNLRSLIKSQLSDDIIKGPFDVGVVQNNSSAVSFRSAEDIAEFWEYIRNGKNITLWCDGMISSKKRKKTVDDIPDTDDEDSDFPKQKRRNKTTSAREDKIDDLVVSLKSKHGSLYTPMQFRIWAEMVVGGVHTSHDVPPTNTMFTRSGSETVKNKSNNPAVQVLDKLATVLSPQTKTASPHGSGSPRNSPIKIIESRSKCYKQLSELKSLHTSEILSDEEYFTEREAVMLSLKSLK